MRKKKELFMQLRASWRVFCVRKNEEWSDWFFMRQWLKVEGEIYSKRLQLWKNCRGLSDYSDFSERKIVANIEKIIRKTVGIFAKDNKENKITLRISNKDIQIIEF